MSHSNHHMGGHTTHDMSGHTTHNMNHNTNHLSGAHTGHVSGHKMYFEFSANAIILFKEWDIDTTKGMVWSCIVVFIMAILYEGFKVFREVLREKYGRPTQYIVSGNGNAGKGQYDTAVYTSRNRLCNWHHCLQSLLQIIQVALSYFLMLVAMTFNGWLFISVCLGAGLGYFIFSWREITIIAGSTRKWKKALKLTSNGNLKKSEHKIKGKKQFSPVPTSLGQVNNYPGSGPYTLPSIKISKGLPKAYDCSHSAHGCCWDGRTPAFGAAGKGCPRCRDVYKDFCKQTKKLCDCPMVADYCRVTCKVCGNKDKSKSCESSKYNCCWDGKTSARGPKGKGCPEIKDEPKARCAMFSSECLRNPYYMWTKCRQTCLNHLPPIEPFIQAAGLHHPRLGIPPPAYGQPALMPPGIPGIGYPGVWPPCPGATAGADGNMGKKTSTKRVGKHTKTKTSNRKSDRR